MLAVRAEQLHEPLDRALALARLSCIDPIIAIDTSEEFGEPKKRLALNLVARVGKPPRQLVHRLRAGCHPDKKTLPTEHVHVRPYKQASHRQASHQASI